MLAKLIHYTTLTRQASRQFGRSPLALWREVLRLRRLPGRLGVSEYFEFGLADAQRYAWADKAAFLGYASYPLYSRLNARHAHALANDKVLFNQVMSAAGLELPKLRALFSPSGREFAQARNCKSEDQLHDFLAHEAVFPLFVKPADGVFGKGAYWMQAYDAAERLVHCRNEKPVALSPFVNQYAWHLRYGLLFQDVVRPHPELLPMCGARVSSVRCLVLLTDSGPELLCANWKVPTGENVVDNTGSWTNGNMVAALDADSGKILSLWQGDAGKARPATRHPDTQIELVGRIMPAWPKLLQYLRRAAVQFPDLRLQGWDIVPAEGGMTSFEVNLVTEATVFANQLVHGRGLLDARLRRALNLS